MTVFVDANVLVRHLTGDPPEMAAAATRFLASGETLAVTDVVVAETVSVLESVYRAPRPQVAQAIRALVGFGATVCVDPGVLLRAVELYEVDRLDFAEAHLVATAESTDVARVASFDRAIDRVGTVARIEPS